MTVTGSASNLLRYCRYFKQWCEDWRQDLDRRPAEVKQSGSGMLACHSLPGSGRVLGLPIELHWSVLHVCSAPHVLLARSMPCASLQSWVLVPIILARHLFVNWPGDIATTPMPSKTERP